MTERRGLAEIRFGCLDGTVPANAAKCETSISRSWSILLIYSDK